MPPVDTTVNVTDSATFTCEVAGVPLPSISWTLPNGSQIISQVTDSASDGSPIFALTTRSDVSPIVASSVLSIGSVGPGDEGEYICTAMNSRDTVSEAATLAIEGKEIKGGKASNYDSAPS